MQGNLRIAWLLNVLAVNATDEVEKDTRQSDPFDERWECQALFSLSDHRAQITCAEDFGTRQETFFDLTVTSSDANNFSTRQRCHLFVGRGSPSVWRFGRRRLHISFQTSHLGSLPHVSYLHDAMAAFSVSMRIVHRRGAPVHSPRQGKHDSFKIQPKC